MTDTDLFLFFDTETTGFCHNKPLDDPKQPHMVELAGMLVTPDAKIASSFDFIISPGVEIPQKVVDIHGVDDEKADLLGVSPSFAIDTFLHFYDRCSTFVCHSVIYDKKVMEIALARNGMADRTLDKPSKCTLTEAKSHGLARTNLTACLQHFFGEDHVDAHNAMADTVACKRIFFEMGMDQ